MNEQKKLLLMILDRLGVTFQFKCIGIHDVYFCRYAGAAFSIFTNGQSVNMNMHLGTYSTEQQNAILGSAESVKKKGYNIVLANNDEKHIGLNVICSSHPDIHKMFFSICYFLQIISVEKFLQAKVMAA